MKTLTPECVKQLWATMTQFYDTTLIEHWRDGAEQSMGVLTLFLNHTGVVDVPLFLQHCEVAMGDALYVPEEPGSPHVHLRAQVAECAALHQRVLHFRRCTNPFEAHLLYLLSPLNRAYAELEATQAKLEVLWWCAEAADGGSQVTMSACRILDHVRAYGVSDLTLELCDAKRRVEEMVAKVGDGVVECEAARDIISYFGWDTVTVRG